MARSTYKGLGEYKAALQRARTKALRDWAELTLAEAKVAAPRDTGDLILSGKIDDSEIDDGVVRITFGGEVDGRKVDYAAAQHEGYANWTDHYTLVREHISHSILGKPYTVRPFFRHIPEQTVFFRNHPHGGGPKYLETPVKTYAPMLPMKVRVYLAEELR
jgi:hypothetical protein